MERLLLVLFLLALPLAAADYTWTSDAWQETVIARARAESNAAACAVVSLPPTCTQAQATAAAAALVPPVPAPNVYNTNQAWVRDVIRDEVRRTKHAQKDADKRTFSVAFEAATPAQKDALCVAVGLPAGCLQ